MLVFGIIEFEKLYYFLEGYYLSISFVYKFKNSYFFYKRCWCLKYYCVLVLVQY